MAPELEGVEWTRVGGTGQTLVLDEGHASGSGGCNRFAGGYSLEGERLSFQPLAATRMACEPDVMTAESEFLAALALTARAVVTDGELVLADPAGAELLRFASTSPTADPEETSWS
jgi:heat shock protein HslJ